MARKATIQRARVRWLRATTALTLEEIGEVVGLSERTVWLAVNPTTESFDRSRRTRKQRKRIAERKAALDRIKRERGCVDCGSRKGRLEFDHVDPRLKSFNVSVGQRAWAALVAEMGKCVVRCQGCHARRHVLARGYIPADKTVRQSSLLCVYCREWLPDSAFASDRQQEKRRSRRRECRSCNTARKRDWRLSKGVTA